MRAPFNNENEFRDYPFVLRTTPLRDGWDGDDAYESLSLSADADWAPLPREAVCDFAAVMGIDVEYDEARNHYVWLHSIRRTGSRLLFEFRTNAPGAAGSALRFSRDTAVDPEFGIEWSESVDVTDEVDFSDSSTSYGSQDDDPCTCRNQALWEGYMVSGRYEQLLELLADGDVVEYPQGLWTVEPAQIQSMRRTFVRSVSLANVGRTTVTDPCDSLSSESEPSVHVYAKCLDGALAFREGYSTAIRQEDQRNTINVGAAVGAGAGLPCGEVPRYPGEVSPDGGRLLTGGPACDEIIQAVNGVTGRNPTIRGGTGVTIVPLPETHEIDLRISPNAGFQVNGGNTGSGGGGSGGSGSGGAGTTGGGSGGGGGGGGGGSGSGDCILC